VTNVNGKITSWRRYIDFAQHKERHPTARAKDIAEYLYDKGIPQSRITYKGYGKRQPIATNQTVDGRRRNQRVEIKIVSL